MLPVSDIPVLSSFISIHQDGLKIDFYLDRTIDFCKECTLAGRKSVSL